jgi:hypothetical protein
VVAAIEIVVDVDFPVAIERVDTAIEVLEFLSELQRSDDFRNRREEFAERRGLGIEVNQDEIFPSVDADGNQAILRAVEIADSVEFNHTFEGAVDAVSPAMIRAAKLFGTAVGFRDDGGGVMAAHVVEGAEFPVVAANDNDRLASDVRGKEFAASANLIQAAGDLPGFSKHGGELQFVDADIAIPGSGNRRGFLQRIGGIVQIQDFADALVHGLLNAGKQTSYRESGKERSGKSSGLVLVTFRQAVFEEISIQGFCRLRSTGALPGGIFRIER